MKPARTCLLGALLALSAIAGCSGGNITGNLPPVTGRVYASDNPEQGVKGVEVRLVGPSGEVVATSLTDERGEFRFDLVGIPLPLESLHLEVAPFPQGPEMWMSDFVPLPEPGSHLLLPLRPSVETVSIPTFRLHPQRVVLQVGDPPVQFRLVVENGQLPLGIAPTWILEGNVGDLTPQGLFTPRRPGRGRVIAQMGPYQAEATVIVILPSHGHGHEGEDSEDRRGGLAALRRLGSP